MIRWCIISEGPRSGSTFLESLIFKNINLLGNGAMLTEYLNMYLPKAEIFYLNSNYHILKIKTNNKTTETRDNFLNYRLNLLSKGNQRQPLTMKIFINDQYTDEQFLTFFNKILSYDFKLISLKRDILERCLSNYFVSKTGILHQFISLENESYLYDKNGNVNKGVPTLPKISIDIDKFIELYTIHYKQNLVHDKMISKFPVIPINYSSMLDDCKRNNIPCIMLPSIKKLYTMDYKDAINNYDELIERITALRLTPMAVENTQLGFDWNQYG